MDKGSTKEETEDPKTIDKFTDRFTTLLLSVAIKHGITKTIVIFSVYMDALKDHVITNAANGKTICVKKHNFPDTGMQ